MIGIFNAKLKDSGKRQEFTTGAVRDTAEGKLRWSLLPPRVWRLAMTPSACETWMMPYVFRYLHNADPTCLMDGLKEELTKNPPALQRLAEHLRKGAEKYQPFNWVKGIPVTRCLDSLGRHLNALCNDEKDEDHYAAALCNLVFIITYHEQGRRELLDFPGYMHKDKDKIDGIDKIDWTCPDCGQVMPANCMGAGPGVHHTCPDKEVKP